jgi:hypothetical protein
LNLQGKSLAKVTKPIGATGVRAMDVNPQDGTLWLSTLEVNDTSINSLTRATALLVHVGTGGQILKEFSIGVGTIALDARRGVLWASQSDVVKMDLEGNVLARVPVERSSLVLERDTGYLWIAAEDGVYRVDDQGKYVWSIPSKEKTLKWIAVP